MKKKPPDTLSKAAKGIWLNLEKEWGFNHADYFLLTRALEQFDRLAEAQALIQKHGLLLKDPKTGKVYPNPAVGVEKDCMGNLLRAWRLLDLKMAPPSPNIGRPPGDRRQREEDF